ncbi:50S ribosomal protein L29 [bacterium]|jgi:ribosomal protein L29|nr:50S ribosomal protein L29 [bacterium]
MKFAKLDDLKTHNLTQLSKTVNQLEEYVAKLRSELKAGHSKDIKSYKLARKQIAQIKTILSEKSLNPEN